MWNRQATFCEWCLYRMSCRKDLQFYLSIMSRWLPRRSSIQWVKFSMYCCNILDKLWCSKFVVSNQRFLRFQIGTKTPSQIFTNNRRMSIDKTYFHKWKMLNVSRRFSFLQHRISNLWNLSKKQRLQLVHSKMWSSIRFRFWNKEDRPKHFLISLLIHFISNLLIFF